MKLVYSENITGQFLIWFEVGFILQMIGITGALIGCCAAGLKNTTLIKTASGLIACAQCLGGLAWFIYGMVIRWRTEGSICSGDKANPEDNAEGLTRPGLLISSGMFIKIWNIIMLSIVGCCCCLAIVGGCVSKISNN